MHKIYELPFLSLTVPGQPSFTFIVLKGVAIYSFCVPQNKESDYNKQHILNSEEMTHFTFKACEDLYDGNE